MKKIVYLLMAFTLVFTTACDPMEDVYDEIGDTTEAITGEISITISEDEYTEDKEDGGLGLSYTSFSSLDDAKEAIPDYLAYKYPVWEAGSLVNVSFNLYDPIRVTDYTVTTSDYDALIEMGDISGAHLSSSSDINDFFTYKYPQADQGTYVQLTYNKLAGKILYTLTDDDYASVGNGQYDNFDIRTGKGEEDIEVRRVKIETILLENFPDTPVNQQYLVTYAAFNNDYDNVTLEMLVEFDGTNYNMVTGTEYELTDADIALIEAELGETYPGPTANVSRFKSFDRRTDSENYWSDEMLVEAFNVVLKNLDPTAVEGSKYAVIFVIYDGETKDVSMLLQLNDGDYGKLPDSLIEETTLFALTDDWAEPFTLAKEDYTAMGQSYPNFSDEDLAWYRIAIYLKTMYPYAEADDMTAVSYDLYSGSVETEYVNFVFDGTNWNAIPSVIETSIKFGQDGSNWVPDNTIKYTLTAADYELVGNGRYGNFDVRAGKAEESEEVRLDKINTILLNNFPASEEGQKYSVDYNVYSGAAEVWNMNVILSGGEYIINE